MLPRLQIQRAQRGRAPCAAISLFCESCVSRRNPRAILHPQGTLKSEDMGILRVTRQPLPPISIYIQPPHHVFVTRFSRNLLRRGQTAVDDWRFPEYLMARNIGHPRRHRMHDRSGLLCSPCWTESAPTRGRRHRCLSKHQSCSPFWPPHQTLACASLSHRPASWPSGSRCSEEGLSTKHIDTGSTNQVCGRLLRGSQFELCRRRLPLHGTVASRITSAPGSLCRVHRDAESTLEYLGALINKSATLPIDGPA